MKEKRERVTENAVYIYFQFWDFTEKKAALQNFAFNKLGVKYVTYSWAQTLCFYKT